MSGGPAPQAEPSRSLSRLILQTGLFCLLAAALAAGVSMLLPKSYRASVRILPALSGTMGGLRDLVNESSLGGVLELTSGRRENPIQTFPEILLGQPVLDRTLSRRFPADGSDTARTVLRELQVHGRTDRERFYTGRQKL